MATNVLTNAQPMHSGARCAIRVVSQIINALYVTGVADAHAAKGATVIL